MDLDALVAAALGAEPAQATLPSGNHSYEFGASLAVPLTTVQRGQRLLLSWPVGGKEQYDTALLGVSVAPPWSRTAYVEIWTDTWRLRQDLGPEPPNWVWLNVSAAISERPGSLLCIEGRGVNVASEHVRLQLFDNALRLRDDILIIAPHPDDAEIAAFGLYADRASRILTITAGNGGHRSYGATCKDASDHYRFKGRLRTIDSVTVPWQGGVAPERCVNLGYFDGTLQRMFDRPDVAMSELHDRNTDVSVYRRLNLSTSVSAAPRQATWTNLVEDLHELIALWRPSTIVAPHPFLDEHPDHKYASIAVAHAVAESAGDFTFLLYTNHSDNNRYPYGPASTLVGLPTLRHRTVSLPSVYSHALSPELQRRKLFALEAMHDIRLSPSRQYQLTFGDGRSERAEHGDFSPYLSYLRRGPRPNELFIRSTRAQFLALAPPGR